MTLFFPSAKIFALVNSIWSLDLKQPLLTLIVRAKKNYVAYFEPNNTGEQKVRSSKQYGEKLKLTDMFDNPNNFEKVTCQVYGRVEEISITAINLLWKPTGGFIRFVLAVSSRGPIVLMTNDLNADPVMIFRLYCFRIRIETMFDMLKNVMFAFNYRFWSKLLDRHSRKPKKNSELKKPKDSAIKTVRSCWEACERFAMLGAIALGILQMLSLKFRDSIWNEYHAYIRTRSRALPSERTVKHVVAGMILNNLYKFTPNAIMRKIKKHFFYKKRSDG